MRPSGPRSRLLLLTLAASLAAVSCQTGGGTPAASPAASPAAPAPSAGARPAGAVIDPGDGGTYAPAIDPAGFTAVIDNPYMPLLPGARWRYEGTIDGERERVTVEVTSERRTIMGISAVVVR